ncbi:hypothetical protein AVEN_178414-1 [Araneus ventricosus]|uniref:Uncharacterized protein n=1 Tax=Araneus ventricosus TaxID=182803 RepID=A0A4Y2BDA0_ARAVE|nr:hypothetical protein AVEN_178414-1 [Araneus ventricosus]
MGIPPSIALPPLRLSSPSERHVTSRVGDEPSIFRWHDNGRPRKRTACSNPFPCSPPPRMLRRGGGCLEPGMLGRGVGIEVKGECMQIETFSCINWQPLNMIRQIRGDLG